MADGPPREAAAIAPPLALLRDRLAPDGPVRVVDIGASPINGPAPYRPLLDAGLAHVTGFEPQPQAHARLLAAAGPHETYLQAAVGDGAEARLNLYRSSGLSSLFPLREAALRVLALKPGSARLVGQAEVQTVRMDDLAELGRVDFLKIDIQGGELAVFRHGRTRLAQALAVQTEVRFLKLYEGEPGFGEVDGELTAQGFDFHNLVTLNRFAVAGSRELLPRRRMHSQMVDADAVYVRGLTDLAGHDSPALVRLALLASGCFGSHDLAIACLAVLAGRGEVAADLPAAYAALLEVRPA